jgi:hypothetical protein
VLLGVSVVWCAEEVMGFGDCAVKRFSVCEEVN